MRVVLDTGILITALITKGTPPDLIYQAWRKKRFQLITSAWQLAEFRRVSRYAKLRTYLKHAEVGNLVNGLRYEALVLKDLPSLDVSPDPDDHPILAMAVAAEANFLVSGDKRDLLSCKKIENVRIVTARQFLEELPGDKIPNGA